jgi:bisphosphoglycerate-dependent phosphoglycerate mutase
METASGSDHVPGTSVSEEILEREIATGAPLTYIFDEHFHVSRKES